MKLNEILLIEGTTQGSYNVGDWWRISFNSDNLDWEVISTWMDGFNQVGYKLVDPDLFIDKSPEPLEVYKDGKKVAPIDKESPWNGGAGGTPADDFEIDHQHQGGHASKRYDKWIGKKGYDDFPNN